MPRVRLKITLPEGTWLETVLTAFDGNDFRILYARNTEDGIVGVVKVREVDAADIVHHIDVASEAVSAELTHSDGEVALIRYVMAVPAVYEAVLESGSLTHLPGSSAERRDVRRTHHLVASAIRTRGATDDEEGYRTR